MCVKQAGCAFNARCTDVVSESETATLYSQGSSTSTLTLLSLNTDISLDRSIVPQSRRRSLGRAQRTSCYQDKSLCLLQDHVSVWLIALLRAFCREQLVPLPSAQALLRLCPCATM